MTAFNLVASFATALTLQAQTTNNLPSVHVAPSKTFMQQETDKRQHTFIQLGVEGKFGYHVSLFESNHQHQVIVSSELKVQGKSQEQLKSFLSKPASNDYYTVLTDKPIFILADVREGRRKIIPVDVYDGIIGIDSAKKLLTEATYEIKKILFTTPMHVEDPKLEKNHFIIFGNNGSEQTKYFAAHLIWGANNYDQVLNIEFDKPVKIENGALVAIDEQLDSSPLKVGQSVKGSISAQGPVTFKVTEQVHFRQL